MEEIEFSRWLFEGRLRQGKNVLPHGLNWLAILQVTQKAIVRIQFLSYFWNPFIKQTLKMLSNPPNTFFLGISIPQKLTMTPQFRLHDKRYKANLFQTGIPIGNAKRHKRGDSQDFQIDFVFPTWYPLCQILAYDEIEIVFTKWI